MIRLARLQVVLYLDFDGVLHDEDVWWHYKYGVYMKTQGRKLFEWLHILEELLAPYPDVKLVLSTTWVRKRSFNYARRQLSPALRKRVIGATYHSREMSEAEFKHQSRVAQITADAARRQPFAWFALEDLGEDAGDWPEHLKEKLVLTDGRRGLSDPAVQAQVRALLERLTRAATAAVAEA